MRLRSGIVASHPQPDGDPAAKGTIGMTNANASGPSNLVKLKTATAGRTTAGPVRILGIGGTTSAKSWSLVPLQEALLRAEALGCETILATVYDLNLPLLHTEWRLEDYPPTLTWLLDQVRRADGIIICSPTYHGTISGAIKNVLDLLIFLGSDTPPYLGGKPVGLMAYGGMTAMGVLHALTNCVRGLKGISVPTHIAVPEDCIDRERIVITNPKIEHRLDLMVEELVSFATQLRGRTSPPAEIAFEG
jgi:FMN reductase